MRYETQQKTAIQNVGVPDVTPTYRASYATAKAVLKKSGKDYKATVYVDGFRRKEIEVFTRGLRDLHIRTKKIRGVKRDENNAFIRLADALCGLVRDADEATPWARDALRQLQEKNIVVEL